jgi:multidrug efflux system outer membrane protein
VGCPDERGRGRSTDKDVTQQNQSSTVLPGVAWEVDVWGRLRSQRDASQKNYEAIALDYAFARQSLAATTAKSWYLAIETRQLLALAEESVTIYTKLLELVNVRRAAGKVADLDVAEARYQLDEAKTQLAIAQGLYIEARRTLEDLIGRYPAGELKIAEAFAPLPPPIASGLPSELLSVGRISSRPNAGSWPHSVPRKPRNWRSCHPSRSHWKEAVSVIRCYRCWA